ncbi:hypothetical protein [Streptomyces griseoaurantiacus]|uniref:hypothetical protein n=1 Tax=Streptomyces griseoaurantiacus TaxID=68213 RepID=UPI0036C7BFCE
MLSTRAATVTVGALALAAALTGCNKETSSSGTAGSGSQAKETSNSKTTYTLGEASPPQESTMQKTKGAKYTVTPTKVRTGTAADLKNSGLDLDAKEADQVPVYVSVTLTHQSGKAMTVGDMDEGLTVKTDKDERARALLVLMGQAKWPNCPEPDTEKQLSAGESADICKVFLIPARQKAAAVELTQGFYSEPLQWPVKD